MGLDMEFYKLPKGTPAYNFEESHSFGIEIPDKKWICNFDKYAYFRKNYTIHEIMCLAAELEEINAKKITDCGLLPYPYLYGGFDYKITKKQYQWIIKILKSGKIKEYIEDYDENDNPEQLLEILKDFDKYDFWYSYIN